MIEVALTIDYEIYGNGEGSLRDEVFAPTEKLLSILSKWDAKLVVFAEAAELEMIRQARSDDAIDAVTTQLRTCYSQGHEIALHLHPQWYNARFDGAVWSLDYSEYNLCTLPPARIDNIVKRSIAYLRAALDDPGYSPVSFRAGNWLFQPTRDAAAVLAAHGLKVDSSVFKGGVQHKHQLDYRPSLKNEDFWFFDSDVNIPRPSGPLLEIPIYTRQVPPWSMFTGKRVALQKKAAKRRPTVGERLKRFRDFARIRQPLKFDFCRMTLNEMVSMTEECLERDKQSPDKFKPMVAIGHSKDLVDFDTIDRYLAFLKAAQIPVTTLSGMFTRVSEDRSTLPVLRAHLLAK